MDIWVEVVKSTSYKRKLWLQISSQPQRCDLQLYNNLFVPPLPYLKMELLIPPAHGVVVKFKTGTPCKDFKQSQTHSKFSPILAIIMTAMFYSLANDYRSIAVMTILLHIS